MLLAPGLQGRLEQAFGLRGSDVATQPPALAAGLDADSDQHGAIIDAALQAHLKFEAGIQFLGGAADLGVEQLQVWPGQCLQHLDDPAGETPWTYISARARLTAWSVRVPFMRAEG